MRDGYECYADFVLQVRQFELHLRPQFGIERGQRLVEQQHLGTHHQAAGEGDALALPARHLVRLAILESTQADQLERLAHPLVTLGPPDPGDLEAITDVFDHVHVREHRVGLEHHVDRALVGRDSGHVLPIDQDLAFGRQFEPGDHPQQGGLAAARGPQQHEEFA